MLKETIISIIIIFLIIALDFATQDYTKQSVEETTLKLTQIKTNIQEKNGKIEDSVEETFESWKKRYNKLAYFIEHDELEKVKTNLINVKSHIKLKNYDMAISSIEEAEFVLEHIEDKNAFNLENIF